MIALYIIRDTVLKADIFCFTALNEGEAVKRFSDFCDDMCSHDFVLLSLLHLVHDDDGNEMVITDIERKTVYEIKKETAQ